MTRIALVHGPNLNMLGRRPSQHYGTLTLPELEAQVREAAHAAVEKGAEVLILTGPQSAVMALRGVREVEGALLMDSYSLLVKHAEAMVAMHKLTGTPVSRKLLYKTPPAELIKLAAEVREIDAIRKG